MPPVEVKFVHAVEASGDVRRFPLRPLDAGWSALVMYRTIYGKHHDRWHMSLIDPRKLCREVKIRTGLADARRLAEGRVWFENRPRAA